MGSIPRHNNNNINDKQKETFTITTTQEGDNIKCPSSSSSSLLKQELPSHQPKNDDGKDNSNWVYPSEQQFYNAMIKKGHKPKSSDVPTILKIHNAVNEQTWNKVLYIENILYPKQQQQDSLSSNNPVQLVKFLGRPNNL